MAEPAPTAEPAATELTAPAPVPVASTDPSRWGRVDESGQVFVKTADGERSVGSWQAGEPAEGLAHFARRFDDIRTEVELLEARIVSGAGDPKQSLTSAKHIKESLVDAAVVGDLAALDARVEYVLAHAKQAIEASKVAREAARAASVARKQELAEEAESIAAESTQWKAAGDRLRTILDEWKTIRGVDRKTDEQLWRRFSKARDTFNRRRGSHFADLDRQRSTAKARKQELVEEAEQLSDSDDWGVTAGRYKALMTEWKAAGRAPKDSDDALWQRFRAAQDKFFARRSAAFSERDAEFTDNAKAKEELLVEAEKITTSDLDAARSQLHRIQERWESIGKVPRERVRELEGRLRAVEEKVRQAADQQWRRTDPEAQARAAQFRERVEEFESKAAKARAAGDNRRAEQAEAQAAQWREWLAAAEQAVATR
ncbi:DNA repair ATPase [Actinosynnema sp. ALI-1.44]|nr:DNA repair ATPase [Actinosynnema sp. ALI-1.44]